MSRQQSIPQDISTDNSSTTLLTNGSVFTGTWEDVSKYKDVTVAVKTDQNGTFSVQFSPDGVNQDSTLTRYYRTNQIEAPHRFTITRQYMRVVFTNDSGSDQTYFRLQTKLGDFGDLNAPMDSTLSQDFDAIVTRPTDFHTEVALSRRQGATTWNKFGYNDDVDAASPEILAEFGGTFQYLTSGETIDIVSSSTNDDGSPLGTGCQQIIIWGVDENWEEQIEIVTMDGTTTITTSSQWIGINRVSIYKAGSLLKNDGKITITANTSSYNMATMPAGEGTTQQMLFYVPVSHQFLAEWLYFNATKVGGSSPLVTLKGWVYSDVATAEFEIYRDTLDTADNEHIELKPPTPFVVGEKSILWFNAETDTNNTVIRGRFSGELVRDVDA